MASESSSAVLDMNDADPEDTDAPSVTDDADGVPLIMEHGYDIAVKVDAPMKQLATLETFVTYRVRCACARWPPPPAPHAGTPSVRRRYNHFKVLHRRLAAAHPLVAVPPLPPLHSARQQLDRYSPSFVAVRTLALNAFLERVAKHPILTHSEDLRIFLTTPDDELDKVFKSESSALNLWGLSAALYGSGETKSANGARVKDPEFTSAADYLQSLQQKLTTLCTLTTKLHKGTAALSVEHMNMKRACDAWATQALGGAARAAGACGAGAGAAQAARAPRPRSALAHAAVLPLLAAYAGAHVDKIRQRDSIHAAYVSGTNATDELHNRLEQASEALRSDLSDWIPKTRSEIKSLLLDLADRQVSLHTQTLMGWEHALKLSTDAHVDELFKTVSKTAVQNLSPSKCRSGLTPTETERDLDDFEVDSNDSTSRDVFVNDEFTFDSKISDRVPNVNAVEHSSAKVNAVQHNSAKVNTVEHNSAKVNAVEHKSTELDTHEQVENVSEIHSDDFIQGVLSDGNVQDEQMEASNVKDNDIVDDKTDSSKVESMSSVQNSKSDTIMDPLRDFSDIDLS